MGWLSILKRASEIYRLLAMAMKELGYWELIVRPVPTLAGVSGITIIYWFVVSR